MKLYKIISVGVFIAVTFFTGAVHAYGQAAQQDLTLLTDQCRNTQIISFNPVAGSRVGQLSAFEYIVTTNTQVESLQSIINDVPLSVASVRNSDGTYTATVTVPQNIQGGLFITMQAQSEEYTACNQMLRTSIVVGSFDVYDNYGNIISPTTSRVSYTPTPSPTPAIVANTTNNSVTNTVSDNIESGVDTDAVSSANNNEVVESSFLENNGAANLSGIDADADNLSAQSASILGGLLGPEWHTTNKISWQWWLVYLWVCISALWLIGVYTPKQASSRLYTAAGIVTAGGIIMWWVINGCYSHWWVPAAIALSGGLVCWGHVYLSDTTAPITPTKNK